VGAVLAIPAIRLSGILLALATMGFGLLIQDMFYQSNLMFGQSLGGLGVPLPDVSWLSSTTGFYYLVLIITVICAAVVAGVTKNEAWSPAAGYERLFPGPADQWLRRQYDPGASFSAYRRTWRRSPARFTGRIRVS